MKIVLTGSTGFIGSEVLTQCLQIPTITSIIAIVRRELPKNATDDPKLKVIIMEDFNSYSEAIVKDIEGADACIWCMGTTQANRALEVDYPLALTNAVTSTLPSTKHPFRYIHLSGATTERDQAKTLWVKSSMRKMKGEAECLLLALPTKPSTQNLWSTLIIKSGFVIQPSLRSPRDLVGWLMGNKACIRVDELAAVMIDAAINGWGDAHGETWGDVEEMVEKGRILLQKAK